MGPMTSEAVKGSGSYRGTASSLAVEIGKMHLGHEWNGIHAPIRINFQTVAQAGKSDVDFARSRDVVFQTSVRGLDRIQSSSPVPEAGLDCASLSFAHDPRQQVRGRHRDHGNRAVLIHGGASTLRARGVRAARGPRAFLGNGCDPRANSGCDRGRGRDPDGGYAGPSCALPDGRDPMPKWA